MLAKIGLFIDLPLIDCGIVGAIIAGESPFRLSLPHCLRHFALDHFFFELILGHALQVRLDFL